MPPLLQHRELHRAGKKPTQWLSGNFVKRFLAFEPAGVMNVIIGNPVNLATEQFFRNGLDVTGGDSGIYCTRLYFSAFQYHCTGSNNAVASDFRTIHNNGTQAYQYVIVYLTSVNNGVVAYGNIVSNNRLSFPVSAVNDYPVLNIHLIANPDTVNIPPYHGIKPDTAVISHFHIAHHCCIGSQKAVF